MIGLVRILTIKFRNEKEFLNKQLRYYRLPMKKYLEYANCLEWLISYIIQLVFPQAQNNAKMAYTRENRNVRKNSWQVLVKKIVFVANRF